MNKYNFYKQLKIKIKPFSDNKGTFHGYDINFKADITKSSLLKRTGFLAEAFNK